MLYEFIGLACNDMLSMWGENENILVPTDNIHIVEIANSECVIPIDTYTLRNYEPREYTPVIEFKTACKIDDEEIRNFVFLPNTLYCVIRPIHRYNYERVIAKRVIPLHSCSYCRT